MKLEHYKKTVVGKVRKANEDYIDSSIYNLKNGYNEVHVVCDGMGGHLGGAVASKTAVECIIQYFKDNPSPNPTIALEKSISFANTQIYAKSIHDENLRGMGTTCTVLLNKGDSIHIAHVGDSRIYMISNKKLYQLTKDHSFVQSLVDAGQLHPSKMESHPKKNELTRALGINPEVEVGVSEMPILAKKGDKFLMCSDGLSGLVNDATIENAINKGNDQNTVLNLIEMAENAGGNDNISVCLISVIESPHEKSVFKDQTNKLNDFTSTQVVDHSKIILKKSKDP